MIFGEPSRLHHPRPSMSVGVKRRQVRQLNRSTSGVVLTASRSGTGARGSRKAKPGQTLRVPARVVMLGPPYPLISPMSRVRI